MFGYSEAIQALDEIITLGHFSWYLIFGYQWLIKKVMRMKKKRREHLKDLIIDHIYHHCYNELVKKIESEHFNISIPANTKIEDDPLSKDLFESLKNSGSPYKSRYAPRGQKYCKVINGKSIHQSFLQMLLFSGFEQSDNLHTDINSALEFLLIRSYIKKNQPDESEYALTPKGVNHYSTGQSFEANYMDGRLARNAIRWSVASFIVAGLSWLGTYGNPIIKYISSLI